MFRPPEYAALINPGVNVFPMLYPALINPIAVNAFAMRCGSAPRLGPKEWSPIGKYKLK